MTSYRVLALHAENPETQEVWADCGIIKAASAEAAIRTYVTANGTGGTYAAVPDRSFRPVYLEVEKVTKVKVIGGETS